MVHDELYEPAFKLLGFDARANKAAASDQFKPDRLLHADDGNPQTPVAGRFLPEEALLSGATV